jgi:hypothetical protein
VPKNLLLLIRIINLGRRSSSDFRGLGGRTTEESNKLMFPPRAQLEIDESHFAFQIDL